VSRGKWASFNNGRVHPVPIVKGGANSLKTSMGEWLNYVQAMDLLGVSRSTLDSWRREKRVTFCKLPNGQLRIRRSILEEWLDGLAED
jgi:excisionase family DNA binding protein